MSKIQDVPFITKVIDTLSDELKSGLYDLIDGKEKTPVFRSLVNNDYAITEANDKGKVQFVTLETLRGNYTGYLAYNSVYCVLIAFKGNTQALDMLNINVAKHTFSFVNEALTILELRTELIDSRAGADVGALQEEVSDIKNGTTHLFETITDRHGNPRFVEGDITMETIEGVTQTYGKWSLSGTHLMIVIGGNIVSGTTLNNDFANIEIPTFIYDKIKPIYTIWVDRKSYGFYNSSGEIQNVNVALRKRNNTLSIIPISPITTITDNRSFSIQFDLLIDSM